MNLPKFDVPVLLEFYCRPEKFIKVFEEIRILRPAKLFLYQDGLKNESDRDRWNKCRDICNNIDWDCEVHSFFPDTNYGCDPSGYNAQRWFFDNVDFGIVLEDDVVPNQDFFFYCKKMLEKYKNDYRVSFISGMNVLDKFDNKLEKDCPYFFTAHGGIWGWASWKRFYDLCDSSYSWLNDKSKIKIIKKDFYSPYEGREFVKLAKKRKKEGTAYFETIVYAAARLNSMFEIVPCRNLTSNIGIGQGGTHSPNDSSELPRKVQSMFFKETYDFPKEFKFATVFERNRQYERKISPHFYDKYLFRIKRISNILFKRRVKLNEREK